MEEAGSLRLSSSSRRRFLFPQLLFFATIAILSDVVRCVCVGGTSAHGREKAGSARQRGKKFMNFFFFVVFCCVFDLLVVFFVPQLLCL